jgi:hypothetical protein
LQTLYDFKDDTDIESKILEWYDGYSWDGKTHLLNPFSLVNFFQFKEFNDYWYESGTPKSLFDLIRKRSNGYLGLSNFEISGSVLKKFDIDDIIIESFMFQSGYLTIEEVMTKPPPTRYRIKIPNKEVSLALSLNLLAVFTGNNDKVIGDLHGSFMKSIGGGDVDAILVHMKSLFASIPGVLFIDCEAYYHSILYVLLQLIGIDIRVEVNMSDGRADAVIHTNDCIYVMEFKYSDGSKIEEADKKDKLRLSLLDKGIAQIHDRGYDTMYHGRGKKVVLIALAFLGGSDIAMRVERQDSSLRSE